MYNDLILENLKTLSAKCPEKLVIRIPLIGGFNDTPSELEQIVSLVKALNYRTVVVLPYHNMAQRKYSATASHLPSSLFLQATQSMP